MGPVRLLFHLDSRRSQTSLLSCEISQDENTDDHFEMIAYGDLNCSVQNYFFGAEAEMTGRKVDPDWD